MKPVNFLEQNTIFAKNQTQYIPLPAWINGNGLVVTKWKGTLIERIKFVLTGTIWLRVLTFNHPIQPLLMEVDYPFRNDRKSSR